MSDSNLKTVALIGRPNVGKSTLFNRLVGKREAIETDIPGTTRDRLFGDVVWAGEKFTLIDVAGIEFGTKTETDNNIQEGIGLAIDNADVIVFVVDWHDKANEIDKKIAAKMRHIDKPVILAVNKADNIDRITDVEEFVRLGDFVLVPISAISGKNSGDLLDAIVEKLKEIPSRPVKEEKVDIKLAIIGRPNVGKSTLINTIAGKKRAVVSATAGTTRDLLSINFQHKSKNIQIIDTAGIRRRGKIVRDTIESFSTLRTYKALRECDIAVLLVDAEEGLVANDVHILGQAKEWGKGILLAVNKIDLWGASAEHKMVRMISILQRELNFSPWLPVVFISSQDNLNIQPLLNQVIAISESRATKIEQNDLDEILEFAKSQNFQLTNTTSITQKKANPPIFELKYKGREKPHYTQIRYLENKIRDVFPMSGTPVFIDLIERRRK